MFDYLLFHLVNNLFRICYVKLFIRAEDLIDLVFKDHFLVNCFRIFLFSKVYDSFLVKHGYELNLFVIEYSHSINLGFCFQYFIASFSFFIRI